MLKVIVKNIETGKHHCIDMPLAQAETYKNLKVGTTVQYYDGKGMDFETTKIEKLIDTDCDKMHKMRPGCAPKGTVFSEFANTPGMVFPMPYNFKPYPWQMGNWLFSTPRGAMKTTLTKKYLDDCRQIRLEHKEVEKYNKKPYFLARLDTIKGRPDGKENLEKMMFPCYVIFRMSESGEDKLGQLVTGFPSPHNFIEYQLIDLSKQVEKYNCCTINRDKDLGKLMSKYYIEVIKGEAKMYKVGKFNGLR